MLEISPNLEVEIVEVNGVKVYRVDNFYQDPKSIVWNCLDPMPPEHKGNSIKNEIWANDRRHELYLSEMSAVEEKIQELVPECKKPYFPSLFSTNMTHLKKEVDFEKYRWWPHIDGPGEIWNVLIYFTKSDRQGTNFYKKKDEQAYDKKYRLEQVTPWIPEYELEFLHYEPSVFNRLIAFNGTITHGAHFSEEAYDSFRLNQVCFFVS